MSQTVVDLPGLPPGVEVRRSTRRRRSVTAYREAGRTIVVVPARMARADILTYVEELVGRLAARERKSRRTDADLQARAVELARRYLDAAATPASVRWVSNQQRRWGSCTPADGTIRLSDRLQTMPSHVSDYVLLHELVHLLVPGHGPDFEAWMVRYPRLLEARAYLAGVDHVLGEGVDTFGTGDDGPDPGGALVEGPTADSDSLRDAGVTSRAAHVPEVEPRPAASSTSAVESGDAGVAALRRTARTSRHSPGPGAEPLF